MKLSEKLTQKDLKILASKGYETENKEYSQEDIKKILLDIEEDMMICSSKSNKMNEISSECSDIIRILGEIVYK